jgi:hypothetical protein
MQLENDRIALQKQVEEARGAAQSKAGEAAILRQKAEKTNKEHEQRLASVRLQHAEEKAKHLAEIERVKNEKEKLSTNNRFLEHDLAFETGKVRQLQRTTQRVPSATNAERARSGIPPSQRPSPNVTPRKGKVLPYRDGFDDGDLIMMSPSKQRLQAITRPNSPSKNVPAGAKRKRHTAIGNEVPEHIPSPPPQAALPLSESKNPPVAAQVAPDASIAADLLRKLAQEQNKLRFIQKLLDHHVTEDPQENIFEALTHFAFPSAPAKKLSTLVYDKLSLRSHPVGGTNADNGPSVADQFADIILALWEQSLTESYFRPIHALISITTRVFALSRHTFIRKYIARAAPLAIATADLVAIPLAQKLITTKNQSPLSARTLNARATTHTQTSNTVPEKVDAKEEEAKQCIDVVLSLQLLQTLAEAALSDAPASTVFWSQMKFDFVLMFLMNGVPLEQMQIMLEMLRLSALPMSFGAIIEMEGGERERQDRRESDTIDRLTVLLGEKFDRDREDVRDAAVWELRSRIVDALYKLVYLEHGAALLAHHRHCIGRLFKHLYSCITALYHSPPPSPSHPHIIASINATMTILYLLCSTTGQSQTGLQVDVRQKLAVVPGGMHVHLLGLTRLAFAERVVFEEGIEEGSVEMAHEMLDEWLSPEEGEGLMLMFGSEGSAAGEGVG